ncbi:MAG: SlyX protein [Hydrogenophilales bacterium CG03_land_8_20_14_0_80_62_28]|nr:SlyX family protein [Betaproteobacteria bacterium]OIO79063.1 MAG: SlyX protein [Hydrogenophilaceae bacterium CG1_02_62_390]PIV23893.1 MAG: SlyX protein [Hydrogenophilales bacterium CG03_land_8_20_14_0_80_62_28]PIW71204.1 MAG: SlyX protein [Hydrogenophilales bacterium CG12_big_fil_rev_8_21_14_0_65_61_21]PIX00971.1 MAG: SlyX protein [Hydrogenophilales bacterium CG_4_8_14_3_um_filter_62_83]PIY98379.1 MAG: SlyX protein [Hydrogenophilales bacterium CG_4_10_14_0_8_um_filter_62_70]
METRLAELEVKLSYAEDMVDTLNKAVFRQQEQIDLLQRQLTALHRQMRDGFASEERTATEEIPPHY